MRSRSKAALADGDIESPAPPSSRAGALKPDGDARGLDGDHGAIALLLLLYTLQGVPLGLAQSVPFLMQSRGVTMTDQAQFSLVWYPFSLKLLWAPLVDSVYVSSFGRRKTWIVPTQLAIGVLLLHAGSYVDAWLAEGLPSGATTDVRSLTLLFCGFVFLAATQDIAVDGLALTVLSERNKELGATCNAIGQSVGEALAYLVFLALYSRGAITLGPFMRLWGWVFLASTFTVALVTRDDFTPLKGSVLGVVRSAYREMLLVLQLPAVRSAAILLLSCRAALGVFDSVTPLRLVEPHPHPHPRPHPRRHPRPRACPRPHPHPHPHPHPGRVRRAQGVARPLRLPRLPGRRPRTALRLRTLLRSLRRLLHLHLHHHPLLLAQGPEEGGGEGGAPSPDLVFHLPVPSSHRRCVHHPHPHPCPHVHPNPSPNLEPDARSERHPRTPTTHPSPTLALFLAQARRCPWSSSSAGTINPYRAGSGLSCW